MQISLGLPDPRDHSSLPLLKIIQAGVARSRLLQGNRARVRLPITAHVVTQIQDTLVRSSNPERALVWAIASVAFFGFFRLGELLLESANRFNPRTDLSWGDVAVDDRAKPTMVRVHLKQSKCNQVGKGVDVILGRTNCQLCPVAAVLYYIAVR